jgi:hypothetical protein
VTDKQLASFAANRFLGGAAAAEAVAKLLRSSGAEHREAAPRGRAGLLIATMPPASKRPRDSCEGRGVVQHRIIMVAAVAKARMNEWQKPKWEERNALVS